MPDLLGLSDFPLGNERVYDNAIAVKSMVAAAILFLIWSNWIPRKFLLILWLNLSFHAAYSLWISGISVDLGKSNLKFGSRHISINLAIFAEKLQLQMTFMCEANEIRPNKYAVSYKRWEDIPTLPSKSGYFWMFENVIILIVNFSIDHR